jgi:hypothetical protein
MSMLCNIDSIDSGDNLSFKFGKHSIRGFYNPKYDGEEYQSTSEERVRVRQR